MVAKSEFNYVRWVLLFGAIVAGYFGWKLGPGYYQKMQAQDLANKCAARMWKDQDLQIRQTLLEPELQKIGISQSDKDLFIKFDRQANAGLTRTCELRFVYHNTHVWGSPINKQFKVKGASSRTGKI